MSEPTSWEFEIVRDIANQWIFKNPILRPDVIGYETDTRKFKIGNGITPWNLLGYSSNNTPEGKLVFRSLDVENRLTYGQDGGFYVPEIKVDPLAYYTLAKN